MSDAVASIASAVTSGKGVKKKPKADFLSAVSNLPPANNRVLQTFWITVAGPPKKDDKLPADQTTKSKSARKAGSQAKTPRGRPPGNKNKPSNYKTTNTTPLLEEETPAALQEDSGLAAETKSKTEEEPREFKIWVLLFTCSTTRAVHLEVAMRLDTPEIIMAIERFVVRRGAPSIIY